jgi:membrane fusion protein, multidrug efflux system
MQHCVRFLGLASLLFPVVAVGCNRGQSQGPVVKPAAVRVANPVVKDITDYEDITGRTESANAVDLKARVTGYLKEDYLRPKDLKSSQLTKEGKLVEEGKVLFVIDPDPFEAEENRTRAIVFQSSERLKRLTKDYARAKKLHDQQSMSDAEFDQITGDFREAEEALKVAKASHKTASINLGYTEVKAPFTGVVSRRFVDPGNLVKADETTLTTIVALDPMYVYFDVDERTLLQIRHWMREGKIAGLEEKGAEILLGLADEEGYPHKGTIDFIDNKLDPGTGTLRLRGVFDNPPSKQILYPGLFVRLRIQIGNPHPAVLVAERALGTDQGQKFLYIVNDKNKVVYKSVKVGSLHDGLRVVEDLLPYQLDDRALAVLRAAKVPDIVLKKLDPVKKKEFTEQSFRKELAKLLTADDIVLALACPTWPAMFKEEAEQYQDQLLAAAQDFEHAKKLKVIVSGLQRVREGTEVEYREVENMLDQRPGQKKK